jgi:hypothetical protein
MLLAKARFCDWSVYFTFVSSYDCTSELQLFLRWLWIWSPRSEHARHFFSAQWAEPKRQILSVLIYLHHQHHHRQNSPFLAIAFLRRFCQTCLELDHSDFTSLDFATVMFLQSKVICLMPDSLFVAFYNLQGYGGGILTCLHTGVCACVRPRVTLFV